MAAISSNLPNRWDWKPGQRPIEPGVTYRFADGQDVAQLRRFASRYCNRTPTEKLWRRWISESGWTVWLACRNVLSIVGVVVTRYTAGEPNRVLVHGVAPGWMQDRGKVWPTLLALACYEFPENPTEIVVRDDDLQTQTALRKCGVVAVEKCSGKDESHVFRYPPGLAFESGNVVDVGASDSGTNR